ncbi:MAG: S-layer homology domain-containing protein [Peptococcaceae bacterium]|nr:S-layer homology domain-containing protein [Peptococcaceae bacterium]
MTVEKVSASGLPVAAKSKIISDVFEITKDKAGDFAKPVVITLPFDKSKVDTSKYDVSIYWLDEEAKEWVQLDNVKVDLANGKASGKVKHFTKFAVLATEKAGAALKDVAGHWAEEYINQLVGMGAITGYPDGTFKPDNRITRAEFVTVLVKAFKLPQQGGKVFNDTAGHWARSYISAAAASGVVKGYDDTTFGPDDLITREQMAVMVVKAAGLQAASGSKTFSDAAQISGWAKSAVDTASACGVIGGYPDGTFKPGNNATRAEAAAVMMRSLKQ